jgi:hypothetical protein
VSLRTRHLACLFLLLSTLGAAEASVSAPPCVFCGHRITALLYRHAIDNLRAQTLENVAAIEAADPDTLTISASSRALFRAAWTMRPPSAHAVALHAVTGSTI